MSRHVSPRPTGSGRHKDELQKKKKRTQHVLSKSTCGHTYGGNNENDTEYFSLLLYLEPFVEYKFMPSYPHPLYAVVTLPTPRGESIVSSEQPVSPPTEHLPCLLSSTGSTLPQPIASYLNNPSQTLASPLTLNVYTSKFVCSTSSL